MRRIDLLITEARQETDNVTFSENSGIQDDQFIRWSNSAQTRLLSLINQTFPHVFLSESVIDVTANVAEYDVPSDTFIGARIENIEFKSANEEDKMYYRLFSSRPQERTGGLSGLPSTYIRKDNKILLLPTPDRAGKLRILRQKVLPKLDIRRAVVSAVTLDTNARTITSLTLDTTVSIDAAKIESEGYITIVDKDGIQKMNKIPVSDVDDTTGVVTVASGFVYESGETISSGQYVLSGGNSTTNSQLNDVAERYLVEFMIWKGSKRDSSEDSQEAALELKEIENDIVQSYSEADADILYPPIINTSYFGGYNRRS